mgnify:CR=1 FL=1
MRLTPEQVDHIAGLEYVKATDGRVGYFYRHCYFAHFCLTEPWLDAIKIGLAFRETPLPVKAMYHILDGWDGGSPDGD